MNNNDLLFLSGNDIPFTAAQITIHQPTIKEIAYIGEETFFTGCELINFSKDNLTEEDKNNLEDKTNFDILIAILREEHNAVMRKNRNCIEMVLALMFPEYSFAFEKDKILLQKENEAHIIDNENFEQFKVIINKMFSFQKNIEEEYNPKGDLSKRIAEKLKERHKRLAEIKGAGEQRKIDILSRYISILSVAERKDMNILLNYTVYQLYDEFERFQLRESFITYQKAMLAGAKDLKEPEDWMKDIHS